MTEINTDKPMYLVPGEVSDDQALEIASIIALNTSKKIGVHQAVCLIGTPIQPCADVETVGREHVTGTDEIRPGVSSLVFRQGAELVRRTDMEAQVARVAAEKDVEIARLVENALPDEMTPDIEAALGIICFQAAPFAHAFRAAGADIPSKAEAEQAYVIFKLLKYVLRLGDFGKASDALLKEARAAQTAGEEA